jgi:hypothetical protein
VNGGWLDTSEKRAKIAISNSENGLKSIRRKIIDRQKL